MINKKAIVPFIPVLAVVGVIAFFFIIISIDLPFGIGNPFKLLRVTIFYWGTIAIFFAFQVGIIYAYFKLGFYVKLGLTKYKGAIKNFTTKYKKYLSFN